jgi:hypothetical protein
MNLTLVFLPPLEGDLTVRLSNLFSLRDRSTEAVISHTPMHLYIVGFGDVTKTYIQTALKWHIRCAIFLKNRISQASIACPLILQLSDSGK